MTEIIPPFKDRLFIAFQEWEKTQPRGRSTITAFAVWLSNNSTDTIIKQQNVDSWINGTIPRDYKYVSVLAEKLGKWVYESLNFTPPNPYLERISRVWEYIPENIQKRIANEAAEYEEKNELSRLQKVPKRRKAHNSEEEL